MIKRLSATIIVDSGLVVNSYNFEQHLPVGKLNHTLRRLQDLEIDDVIILNTTHSEDPAGDFRDFLSRLDTWHISTPLSYGGGIMSLNQAIDIVKSGAERVVITSKLLVNSKLFSEICSYLGEQAVVLHLPLEFESNNVYIKGNKQLELKSIFSLLPKHWGGEILLSFVANDGRKMPDWKNIEVALEQSCRFEGLVLTGGFACPADISQGLSLDQVSAIAVGNFLHRTEISVTTLKQGVDGEILIRRPQ
jgi:imidazole glycerol-phosphate synthase subunit HisF